VSKVAVVTGGASGIGLSCAQHLATVGFAVALLDRQGDLAREAAEVLGASGATAVAYEVDVADRVAIDAVYDQVRSALGPIAAVVTSAGIEKFESVMDISAESWERMIAINLTGTFHCIQAALPDMLAATWGRIVTISSMSAQSGAPRMAHYVASKGGVIALTKALAVDLAPHGITVNTIPPSVVDTPMADQAKAAGDFPGVEVIAKMTPVRRAGTADDIGSMCAYLCSDAGEFITGQQIGVNGGWYM
jgi:NAD(P)-dependent dehydrogenase (short-subunit alcohol dehydrogenase family)